MNIEKRRIGNDVSIRWKLTTNGEYSNLSDRDLTVTCQDMFHTAVPIEWTVSGCDVIATIRGKNQRNTGIHVLTLIENKGKNDQHVVDVKAVELVAHTWNLDHCHGGEVLLTAEIQTGLSVAEIERFREIAAELGTFVGAATDITYSDLAALRNEGTLVPGQMYRITDFVTTTAQEDTLSAGHVFDILVRADTPDELSETAYAVRHDGDTYFENARLEAWQLKYCLDNDVNRFAWADPVDGKGVIYDMQDEFGNRCPYDFKNIMFKRSYCWPDEFGSGGIYLAIPGMAVGSGNELLPEQDDDNFIYVYTFSCLASVDENLHDKPLQADASMGLFVAEPWITDSPRPSNNVIEPYFISPSIDDEPLQKLMALPNITFQQLSEDYNSYNCSDNHVGGACHDLSCNGQDFYNNDFQGRVVKCYFIRSGQYITCSGSIERCPFIDIKRCILSGYVHSCTFNYIEDSVFSGSLQENTCRDNVQECTVSGRLSRCRFYGRMNCCHFKGKYINVEFENSGAMQNVTAVGNVGSMSRLNIVTVPANSNYEIFITADENGDAIVTILGIRLVTHSELMQLRAQSRLMPGQLYRITDFVTTTAQDGTQSAGHPFDIIVRALDSHTLDETAKAVQHNGDAYFSNTKMESWQLKYCLDNDTDRFAWADTENGKGVIYDMQDEFGNRCPYDFKNIMFKRFKSYTASGQGYSHGKYMVADPDNLPEGLTVDSSDFIWAYTFCSDIDFDGARTDYSLTDEHRVFHNVFRTYGGELPNNVMFGDANHDNSFGVNCFNNSFGEANKGNVWGRNNSNNAWGHDNNDNRWGGWNTNNTWSNGNAANSWGNENSFNSWRDGNNNNTLENNNQHNQWLDRNAFNTWGGGNWNNSLATHCHNNTWGHNCTGNSWYDEARYNTMFDSVQYTSITDRDVRNVQVLNGVKGTSSSILRLPFVPLTTYTQVACFNASGNLKIIVPGNLA